MSHKRDRERAENGQLFRDGELVSRALSLDIIEAARKPIKRRAKKTPVEQAIEVHLEE